MDCTLQVSERSKMIGKPEGGALYLSIGCRLFIMLKFILLFIFTGAAAGSSGPETVDRSLSLEPVRSENSMSQQSVQAVTQDSLGYIWIGTREGLNRFDGYSYRHFLHIDGDSASLADNRIVDLHTTAGDDLLVLTSSALHRYNRDGEEFIRLLSDQDRSFNQTRLYEDADGSVWFLSAGILFCLGPGGDTELRSLDLSEVETGGNNNRILVNAAGYAKVWNNQTGKSRGITYEDGEIIIDEEEVPFDLHKQWRQKLELIGETHQVEYPYDELAGYFVSARVNQLAADQHGNLWFKNYRSLFRFSPVSGYVDRIQIENSDPLIRNISEFYPDQFGGVWLGTMNGLFYYNSVQIPFRNLSRTGGAEGGLTNNLVSVISQGTGDTLLVGTIGGGLNLVVDYEVVKAYRHDPDQPGSIPNDVIWSVMEGEGGTYWLATDHGFSRFFPEDGRFERFGVPDGSVYRGAGSETYTALARDCDGDLWLGTYTKGLMRMRDESDHFYQYVWPASGGDYDVLYVHTSADCRIWVGTGSSGLFYYSEDEDLLLPAEDNYGVIPGRIYQIREEEGGPMLLSTNAGLIRFDPVSGAAVRLFREWGFPLQTVYASEKDRSGNIWMSTNNGLIRYSAGDGRAVRITESSGLMAKEFIRNASGMSADGTIYFGSMDGLIFFDPDAMFRDGINLPVMLTGVRKTGSEGVEWLNPVAGTPLEFTHRDHSVAFSFLAMNYVTPAQNRYRYRLLPLETEWTDGAYTREATYLNIPPGEYRFEVQASAGEENWSEAAFVDIRMVPPFWQTAWFYLVLILATGVILFFAHKLRVRRLLHEERIRMSIASDLHDEVGGNLSSITLLTEIMKQKKELSDEQRRRLERVQKASAQTMEAMSDIVWAINPGNDRVEDLVLKMKEVAAQMLPEQEYTIEVDEELQDQQIDLLLKRDLFLIFKEAVTNIAKHSGAGRVVIRLEKRGKELILRVKDDGCGFERNGTEAGMGLKSMKNRARKLNGRLKIDSKPKQGTLIQFTGNIT